MRVRPGQPGALGRALQEVAGAAGLLHWGLQQQGQEPRQGVDGAVAAAVGAGAAAAPQARTNFSSRDHLQCRAGSQPSQPTRQFTPSNRPTTSRGAPGSRIYSSNNNNPSRDNFYSNPPTRVRVVGEHRTQVLNQTLRSTFRDPAAHSKATTIRAASLLRRDDSLHRPGIKISLHSTR